MVVLNKRRRRFTPGGRAPRVRAGACRFPRSERPAPVLYPAWRSRVCTVQRPAPFASRLRFLCRRLCGRRGSPSCSALRCFVSAHLAGSPPPTRVTCRARTPGEGSPGAAHLAAARRGRAHRPEGRRPPPTLGASAPCPPSPLITPRPPKPLTPRLAAPPRRSRPTDSCKGFPLLVVAAACFKL